MTKKVIEDVKAPFLLSLTSYLRHLTPYLYMILKDTFKKPETAAGAKSHMDNNVIYTY